MFIFLSKIAVLEYLAHSKDLEEKDACLTVNVNINKSRTHEVVSTFAVLLGLAVAYAFLPNRTIDPWGLFNPRTLAKIICIIAAIESGGYYVEKFAGHRAGVLMTGFFGGLASSTALFVSMAQKSKKFENLSNSIMASCLMATAANLILCGTIVFSLSEEIFFELAIPLGISSLLMLVIPFLPSMKSVSSGDCVQKNSSPFDFVKVLNLSLVIIVFLAVASVLKSKFGPGALSVFSFFAGLFELHSLSLANTSLYINGQIGKDAAVESLRIAIFASIVSKVAIVGFLGSRELFKKVCVIFSIIFMLILPATYLLNGLF
jgi:uncharacterized membrane protein (DUF4010 family)